MGRRDPKLAKVWRGVDEILWNEWDPIGVNDSGHPNCRDEYTSYIAGIYQLLENGAGESQIAKHLQHLETVEMGLTRFPGGCRHCKRVARQLRQIDLSKSG